MEHEDLRVMMCRILWTWTLKVEMASSTKHVHLWNLHLKCIKVFKKLGWNLDLGSRYTPSWICCWFRILYFDVLYTRFYQKNRPLFTLGTCSRYKESSHVFCPLKVGWWMNRNRNGWANITFNWSMCPITNWTFHWSPLAERSPFSDGDLQ